MKGDNQHTQRKRKYIDAIHQAEDEANNSKLDLSLSLPSPNPITPVPEPEPEPVKKLPSKHAASSRPQRGRRNTTRGGRIGTGTEGGRRVVKSETIPNPYPWATDRRATVHTLKYLLDNGILMISGLVQCKKCEKSYSIEYDVKDKFEGIANFVMEGLEDWHDRAPEQWTAIKLPTCKFCGQEDSCKPILSEKKKSINWLFLLLGQLIGCCTLDQLKYFCKHTNIHRTGAKNRVLLYTYLALCKQLEPHGLFNYPAIP
ncbi:uncharacterized protein [Spinacia oleracea]|uniref:DUF7086 domain-containing protein n=1 Tax=Spinacia oleracea TaxID=3562 RepID=A0A9R0IDV7_SPIOL|nr:uncharacterized protein LOC110787065 [Spinacia oleracea]